MKIYTKFGDEGQTALFDGTRVGKDHLRIETYGAFDELNSMIGLAITSCRDGELLETLLDLQRQLFTASADLATPLGSRNEVKITRIEQADITELEELIDDVTATLPPLQKFILPGGSETGARLHVARTICRRGERSLVTLIHQEDVGPHLLVYFNRFSDLLFTLARRANVMDGVPDIEWDGMKE